MADIAWQICGDYFETCNCDYLCPCPESHLSARPTRGDCIAALAFRIDAGHYGDVALDGLVFIVVLRTPGPMIDGNWTLGVIVDERANAAQRDALGAIGSGRAGGSSARLALVTGTFAGVESSRIDFEIAGMTRSLAAPGLVDQAIDGVAGRADPDQPLYLDNVGHLANRRLALAKATRSHIHAFGIDWDDDSGLTNGHFAPFDWRGP